MKRISLLLALAILGLTVAFRLPMARGLDQGSEPRFDGDFDDATAVQAQIDRALASGSNYYRMPPPPPGKHYHFKSKIRVVGKPYFTLVWDASGCPWDSIYVEHDGVAIEFMGMKQCRIVGIPLILMQSNSVGFDNSGDGDHQSDSNSIFDTCRVQPYWQGSVKNCTGYRIGNTGNDHSFITYERCSFYSSNNASPADIPGAIASAHRLGHRGFEILGGNTCAMRYIGCDVSGADIAFSTKGRSGESPLSGGSGTTFEDCGGSYDNLCFWIDGGFAARITGGRWEEGAAFLLHGNPRTSGRGLGHVSISDIVADSFDTTKNDQLGYVDKNTLIGIYSDGTVNIRQFGGYGNKMDASRWVGVRSNNVGAKLNLDGNYMLDTTKRQFEEKPLDSVSPVEGKLRAASDHQ